MKLISMTDFVLENQDKIYNKEDSGIFACRVINYANFLKQPLKLEMFVPCDEGGNVLEQPCDVMNTDGCRDCACREYKKAKEKVLFESDYKFLINISGSLTKDMTIEDLIKHNLTLTENATKQFL